ncbi:hypothetical protein [Aulosira sp. FACHB-615]|uniref:hypothetical protein n=1 Tax=Aulosira sp. FACHB-615 TaxID=2692777 RepID=UPI0016893E41|nr:hypothetical protein [Aulosira sp. FACHB-615]MBD2487778.1 hypothetical protein [Aulosira sp. FACHB-615]
MLEVTNYHQELAVRIARILDKFFKNNSLYLVRLNKKEMIGTLVETFAKFTPEEMRIIKDDDLTERINSILVLEAVSGTLNELTPEQIAIFDAVVEGK